MLIIDPYLIFTNCLWKHVRFDFSLPQWFNIVTCVGCTPPIPHFDFHVFVWLSIKYNFVYEDIILFHIPLCNSNMSHSKAHDNFTIFNKKKIQLGFNFAIWRTQFFPCNPRSLPLLYWESTILSFGKMPLTTSPTYVPSK